MMKITNKYLITCLLILGSSYCLADNSTQSQEQQPTSVMNLAENDDTELLSLLPSYETDIVETTLTKNGSFEDNTVNGLFLVYHLDGCIFCEDTLYALELDKNANDSVINYFKENEGINVAELLVWYEDSSPDLDLFYCRAHDDSDYPGSSTNTCEDFTKMNLGVNLYPGQEPIGWGYPTIYFYENSKMYNVTGSTSDLYGPGACGLYIRSNGSKTDITDEERRNAASNWVCSVVGNYSLNEPDAVAGIDITTCDQDLWKTVTSSSGELLCYSDDD